MSRKTMQPDPEDTRVRNIRIAVAVGAALWLFASTWEVLILFGMFQ